MQQSHRDYNTLHHNVYEFDWLTYQYPLYEHVIVLLRELRSAKHKSSQQLYSCLSHTCGVVHQTTMDATLHVGLQKWTRKCQIHGGKNDFTRIEVKTACIM